MARIYAEEAERRGNKVKLAYEKEETKQEDVKAVEQSTNETDKSQQPEQEVIVLRGGFTQW